MASGGHYPPRTEQNFWRERAMRQLPPEARTFLAWLYACPEQTAVPGLILSGRAALAESVGYPMATFDNLIGILIVAGFVVADWDVMVCYLPAATKMRCNCATSIYQAAHWRRVLSDAPSCSIVERVERDVRELLGQNRAGDKGKAMLASFLLGEHVKTENADLVLANLAPKPQQQTLPFPWATAPQAGERVLNKEPDIMPEPRAVAPPPLSHASPPTGAVAIEVGDDNAALAFREVLTGAGGPEALGMARIYSGYDDIGLPGSAGALWTKHWAELRKTRPATTLASARQLGEYGAAGGWEGLQVPWQALVKSSAGLAAQLDAAEFWVRRGRAPQRKTSEQNATVPPSSGAARGATAKRLSWSCDPKGNPVAVNNGEIGSTITIELGDKWDMAVMADLHKRCAANESITLQDVRAALAAKPQALATEAASAMARQLELLRVPPPKSAAVGRGGR